MAQHWFKHDYSARNDEKILELRAEYGWKGYGLFFAIVETMCETEKGCIDTDRIGGLSVGFSLPKDELLNFIDFCTSIELLYEDDDGLIRNKRVVEHLDHMNTLKEAGKKGANKRWKQHKNRGANGGANATPNAEKIREDKKREEYIPSLSEVKEYFKQNGYDPKVAEKAFDIYNASLEDHPQRKYWRDSRDNPIKNWKLKMQSVWFKDENKINGHDDFNPENAKRFQNAFK